jgi:Asp-tRNA(Asn)/Glu-tRNA(Gln) amidotransferase A subunit family amidase
VPAHDAVVVARLERAGAILLAKLSLGALALNDIWFGGQTMNPWLPEEGASGVRAPDRERRWRRCLAGLRHRSAKPEAAIIAPSMRCGVTGLRPYLRPRGRAPAQ